MGPYIRGGSEHLYDLPVISPYGSALTFFLLVSTNVFTCDPLVSAFDHSDVSPTICLHN